MLTGVPFKIAEPDYYIMLNPILSRQEKQALEVQALFESLPQQQIVDKICEVYNVSTKLPQDLKLAALLKVREISNGSDCKIKFKCPNCSRVTEDTILLEDMLDFSNYKKVTKFRDFDIKNLTLSQMSDIIQLKNITSVKLTDILSILDPNKHNLEFSNLGQLTELAGSMIARIGVLKTETKCKCILCQHEHSLKIDQEFILNNLSEHSISSMYKTYHQLVINGFSKLDVDSMYPFEREIHVGLIDQRIQEMQALREQQKNLLSN